MSHLVDTDCHCQDDNVILAGIDGNPVAVPQAEPFLGYLRHLVVPFSICALVIQNVSFHLQVWFTLDLDHPALANLGDQGIFNHGDLLATRSFDLYAVLDAQNAVLDLTQLVAMCVLEDQGLECFTIHLEHFQSVIILNPEVIADGDHLLAHPVAIAPSTRSPELAVIPPFFMSAYNYTISRDLND
jgi:hypothetical protein